MQAVKNIISICFNIMSQIAPQWAGKISFYFFCFPFKAKLKDEQNDFLNSARKSVLIVEGKKVQCYSWGNGKQIILFVHGWQSHSYRWRDYIEKLDMERFHILAFDAPGHGNSEGHISNVPLYEKTMQSIIIEFGTPYAIVAHSIGAFASMYFLYKNKINPEKVVFLASPYSAEQFISFYRSELSLSDRSVEVLKNYFEEYGKHPVEYFNIENFAPDIKSKSLIIHDSDDKTTDASNSRKLHEILSDSQLIITKGLGHRLRDKMIIEAVQDFLRSDSFVVKDDRKLETIENSI